MSFTMKRRVHFYETDAMGVVHHANYLRYFEECRGEWFRSTGADQITWVQGYGFPVLETATQHLKPARFDDEIEICMQLKMVGVRIHFQYAIFNAKTKVLLATGRSVHVPIDKDFKVCKLPNEFHKLLEKEQWTETWP